MPFTLAHPAAVLPLVGRKWRWIVPAALVIGSMAPDFHYFVPFHQLDQLSGSQIPLLRSWLYGLIMWILWEAVLRDGWLRTMPVNMRARIHAAPPRRRWEAQFLPALLCVLLGAVTHVTWDAFTHAGHQPARYLPALERHLGTIGGYNVFVYKILQHGSTVGGLCAIAVWTAYWWRRTPPASTADNAGERPRVLWWIAAAVCLGAIVPPLVQEALLWSGETRPLVEFQHALGRGIRSAAGLMFVGFVLGGLVASWVSQGRAKTT